MSPELSLSPDKLVARNSTLATWRKEVLEYYRYRCVSCSSEDNLQVMLIVPEDAGGLCVLANSTVLCRDCEIAKAAVEQSKMYGKPLLRPINVWISRKLYDNLKLELGQRHGFTSMSSLVRYMVNRVVEQPDLFRDLEFYQDRGTDLKVNLWVDAHEYEKFKRLLVEKTMTVTDGIKALMLLYTTDVAPSVGRK